MRRRLLQALADDDLFERLVELPLLDLFHDHAVTAVCAQVALASGALANDRTQVIHVHVDLVEVDVDFPTSLRCTTWHGNRACDSGNSCQHLTTDKPGLL